MIDPTKIFWAHLATERKGRIGLVAFIFMVFLSVAATAQDAPKPDKAENVSATAEVAPPKASGEKAEVPADSPEPSLRDRLVSDYELDADALDSVEDIQSLINLIKSQSASAEAGLARLERERAASNAVGGLLLEQLGERLPKPIKARTMVRLGSVDVSNALVAARSAALVEQREDGEQLVKLLVSRIEEIESVVSEPEEKVEVVESQRKERAEKDEAEALQALEAARAREERERDETMKRLLVRKRELAEKVLDLTRSHNEEQQELAKDTKALDEAYSNARAKLLSDIDSFPAKALEEQRQAAADPAYREAVRQRNGVRNELISSFDLRSMAQDDVAAALKKLAQAREKLAEEQGRDEQFQASDLFNQRVAVAQAEVDYREKEVLARGEALNAWNMRVAVLTPHERFFNQKIRELLEETSPSAYSSTFSLTDENVDVAIVGMQLALKRIEDGVRTRGAQLMNLDEMIFSVSVWTWIGGLLLHLIPLGLLFFFLPWIPTLLKQFLHYLLSHRTFRRHPAGTMKAIEVINEVSRPVLFYFCVIYVVRYLTAAFPEIEFARDFINVVFLYVFVMELASVLFLPRAHRQLRGDVNPEDLGIHGQDLTLEVLGMTGENAKKLVTSVRVALVFSLLAWLVPSFVDEVFGVSLVWFWTRRIASWGLAVIIYWVISTWRDEIASIFERITTERLPWAARVVVEQKDKPWGVLLIAFASVYVIAYEMVSFARKYVLNTEWFKSASNFAFRKRIELQQREREETQPTETAEAKLPEDYQIAFTTVDSGEEYIIDRDEDYAGQIVTYLETWITQRRRGSVAMVAETGMGRSTLVSRFADAIVGYDAGTIESPESAADADSPSTAESTVEADSPAEAKSMGDAASTADLAETPTGGEPVGKGAFVIRRDRLSAKMTRRVQVLQYVAALFELESVPADRQSLIDTVKGLPPRIIIIDDCHHLFMRQIGGFDALDTLLDIVTLTDHKHFWLLSISEFAWDYVNRVKSRFHQLGTIMKIKPWSEGEIQRLVEIRNARTDYSLSYTDLVVAHDEEREDSYYEVVKTAKGYFRYLHEFVGGNPRLAMVYWLRSLKQGAEPLQLDVTLFRRPKTDDLDSMTDAHWFVLTALAQHGELNAREIASIINSDEGTCALALNFFEEGGIISVNDESGRARLTALYFRQILKRLTLSNYLYR